MTEPQIQEIKRQASAMAALAVERALSRDWREHPMFGIGVDQDQWAISFQHAERRLEWMLRETLGEPQ